METVIPETYVLDESLPEYLYGREWMKEASGGQWPERSFVAQRINGSIVVTQEAIQAFYATKAVQ